VLATVPNSCNVSGLGLEPGLNCCNGSYHTKTRTVAIGPVLPPKTPHFNSTTMAPIQYFSSDRIMTWSICRLCRFSRSFTSRLQIGDATNIRWVAIETPQITHTICTYFTTTKRISVGLQIWMQEVNELLKLQNLRVDHVTIWSAFKYLIRAKVVGTV